MNSIEEKIWAYIDGSCSDEEKHAIDLLIQQDDNYRETYKELSALNQEMSLMELDEPSMVFTYNVLETIQTENAKQPLKTTINTGIIKAIAAFFVIIILGLLIFTLSQVNWSENTTTGYTIPKLNLLNGRTLKIFAFFDILLGAFLLDAFLHKKSSLKHL